jgi:hypothetical protein
VRKLVGCLCRSAILVSCGLLLIVRFLHAQQDNVPGHSIGRVSTQADLIVMELDDTALGVCREYVRTSLTLRWRYIEQRQNRKRETGVT